MIKNKTIFFIVSIDTECDKSVDWSITYPLSFRNIHEGVAEKLQPLFDTYNVKPTYLLSPEVMYNEESVSYFKAIQGRCELGTHLHGEFIDPDKIENPKWTNDFQADYSKSIESQKLANLTNDFRTIFGYEPKSFRAGRFGIGPNTWKILSELGYKVDSSLLPLNIIKTRKAVYNFYSAPVKPFFPDCRDWSNYKKTNPCGVLHVPMTVHNWFFQRIPPFMAHKIAVNYKTRYIIRKLFGKLKVKTFSLRPSNPDFETQRTVINRHIDRHDIGEPIILNMMFHSNELVPCTSPYAQTMNDVNLILDCIKTTIEYVLKKWEAHPIGLSDTFNIYTKTE